jgi:hypothetical protein
LIERAIANVETVMGRKLTGEELLILGVAYQNGYLDGLKKGGETLEEDTRESPEKTTKD